MDDCEHAPKRQRGLPQDLRRAPVGKRRYLMSDDKKMREWLPPCLSEFADFGQDTTTMDDWFLIMSIDEEGLEGFAIDYTAPVRRRSKKNNANAAEIDFVNKSPSIDLPSYLTLCKALKGNPVGRVTSIMDLYLIKLAFYDHCRASEREQYVPDLLIRDFWRGMFCMRKLTRMSKDKLIDLEDLLIATQVTKNKHAIFHIHGLMEIIREYLIDVPF